MRKFVDKIKERDANSIVEYVIILPLIFIIVYALIVLGFMLHDKSTIDAAAKRGAIFAAHCISDSKYLTIIRNSGTDSGALDLSVDISDSGNQFVFTGCSKKIQAYRYLKPSGGIKEDDVKNEVENIINETRIPWRTVEVDSVDYKYKNSVICQEVTVICTAVYEMPDVFSIIGLDEDITYTAEAKMAVNDPDEFIRNADLVVDLLTEIDNATGNHGEKAIEKISGLASKLLEWLDLEESEE